MQRQVSLNRQVITLTYIIFISTNHSMCTLCHIMDTDDHRLSYNSDHFIRNCSKLFWEIYIASKTSILFFNICKNFKKNFITIPFCLINVKFSKQDTIVQSIDIHITDLILDTKYNVNLPLWKPKFKDPFPHLLKLFPENYNIHTINKIVNQCINFFTTVQTHI